MMLPELITDGIITFSDNSESFVKTKFRYSDGGFCDLTTFIEHSTIKNENGIITPVSSLKCKPNHPLARIHMSIEPKSTFIEGFYVYPQTRFCEMTQDERNAFKHLGELIFTIGFTHVFNYYNQYYESSPEKIDIVTVGAQVFGNKYDHTDAYDHSNLCTLLDKVYRLKYHFKKVQFNTNQYTELDENQIELCKKDNPHYIAVKSKLTDITSNLINFLPVFDLYKFKKIQ